MWVPAWACMYFPHGCSRSPLNKAAVLLLSKPTSFVSNEHLPGSFPTTAGFGVSPCQQPMTLICCFITPKRCVCRKQGVLQMSGMRVLHKQCVFGIHRCVYIGIVFVSQSHNEPEGSDAAADTICIGQLILAQRKTSWKMTVIKTDSGGLRCLQYLLYVSARPFRCDFFFKETSGFFPVKRIHHVSRTLHRVS